MPSIYCKYPTDPRPPCSTWPTPSPHFFPPAAYFNTKQNPQWNKNSKTNSPQSTDSLGYPRSTWRWHPSARSSSPQPTRSPPSWSCATPSRASPPAGRRRRRRAPGFCSRNTSTSRPSSSKSKPSGTKSSNWCCPPARRGVRGPMWGRDTSWGMGVILMASLRCCQRAAGTSRRRLVRWGWSQCCFRMGGRRRIWDMLRAASGFGCVWLTVYKQ